MPELLGPQSLRAQRVAVSVSESADLGRLGLLEAHFRLALAEVARAVLTAGGTLAYGGHLRRDGYTAFLANELERWRASSFVIKFYVPYSVHSATPVAELDEFESNVETLGDVLYLDADGCSTLRRANNAVNVLLTAAEVANALTSMRARITRETEARVLLGGRRSNFSGRMPGLVEEAMLSLEAGQPLFLAGGFGGVTHDIAKALHLDPDNWLPPWDGPAGTEPETADSRSTAAIDDLARRFSPDGWQSLRNGLTEAENQRLAMTHRPSEVASLVSLGLGRLAA